MRNRELHDAARQVPAPIELDEAEVERRVAAIPPGLDSRQLMAALIAADPSIDPDELLIEFYLLDELLSEDRAAVEERMNVDPEFRANAEWKKYVSSVLASMPVTPDMLEQMNPDLNGPGAGPADAT